MLGIILLAVGWTAAIIEILVYWILSYFPIRINWGFALSMFAASMTAAGIGMVILIGKLICWLFGLIF